MEKNAETKKFYSNLSYKKIIIPVVDENDKKVGEKTRIFVGGLNLYIASVVGADGTSSKDLTQAELIKKDDNASNDFDKARVNVILNNEAKNIKYYTGVDVGEEETLFASLTVSGRALEYFLKIARKGNLINITNAEMNVNESNGKKFINIYADSANSITLARAAKKETSAEAPTEEPADELDDLIAGI